MSNNQWVEEPTTVAADDKPRGGIKIKLPKKKRQIQSLFPESPEQSKVIIKRRFISPTKSEITTSNSSLESPNSPDPDLMDPEKGDIYRKQKKCKSAAIALAIAVATKAASEAASIANDILNSE